jgi:DNA-directed RNA polymerase subunit RPC12/RpoP
MTGEKAMSDARRDKFYCSECGHELDGEFVERLRQGEPVYCEACGSRITVRMQKRVGLPRAEIARPQTPLRKPAAPEPTMDDILAAQRRECEKPPQASAGPRVVPDWYTKLHKPKKDPSDKGIQILNTLSILVGVLTLTTIPRGLIAVAGTVDFYWQIAMVACALGSIITDIRFHSLIKQRDYSFRGIDLIIWGFVGCFGYGVGALVLVKGILIVVYTAHPKSGYPHLTRAQKFHVVISRLNTNSTYVGFLILFGTLPAVIASYIASPGPDLITRIVLGTIALLFDAFLFKPKLKQNVANRRNLALGAGMLAIGIIGTIDFAMGVVLLLKGVAILLLCGISEPQQKPPVPVGPAEIIAEPAKGSETIPVTGVQVESPTPVPIPVPEMQVQVPTPLKTPTPIIMAPARPAQPIPSSIKSPEPPAKEPSVVPSSEDFEKQAAIQSYLNRVYTVLSSKIRDRVQKLDIQEKEKREVLDGLVTLTSQEQEQFLTELEELARRLMPELVGRILRLNLSKEQNEGLLRQMEYLSDQEQLEFVAELEHARTGAV